MKLHFQSLRLARHSTRIKRPRSHYFIADKRSSFGRLFFFIVRAYELFQAVTSISAARWPSSFGPARHGDILSVDAHLLRCRIFRLTFSLLDLHLLHKLSSKVLFCVLCHCFLYLPFVVGLSFKLDYFVLRVLGTKFG